MSSLLLFDARSLAAHTGGVPRVARRVLAHLHASRPDVRIVHMTTGWRTMDARPDALHLRIPNKLWSLACVIRLTSLDRVATRMMRTSFDELILPNVGFVGIPRIPYTLVVHDVSFLIEPRWFSRHVRLWHRLVGAERLIRNASAIWCVSNTTARDVERLLGVSTERMTVLPPEVIAGGTASDLPMPSDGPAEITGPYVITFDGSPRKNAATAIATVARVREDARFKNLQLVIIGSPSLPFRNSELEIKNVAPGWIIRKTSVTDAELEGLYQHAAALLYPSWYEGFGLPLHEAARFGIPLIASVHGALPETAPPGTVFVSPAKPHLWAAALQSVLKIAL